MRCKRYKTALCRLAGILLAAILWAIVTAGGAGIGDKSRDNGQRYAYPLATGSPEDTVTQIYAETFAQEVSRLSGGRIKIQVYPNSVLGGDRELLESCYDGDIPFVVQNTAPQVNFIPDTAVFDTPCAFESLEEVRKTVDDPVFMELMREAYRAAGYELLGYSDQGFRVMSTNKEVTEFRDFKGQKIRTMENSYHIDFWKCLGANPTPMSYSEVYIGLQQHTIDAQENPYEVIVSNRLYEQQDYVVETNHLPHLVSLITSETFFQGLSNQDQAILMEAQEIAREVSRKASDERIADKIRVIEESGTQIMTLDQGVRQEMADASAEIYRKIEDVVKPEIMQAYLGR